MTVFTALVIFIFGAAIGSFLSVVVHRLDKKGKSIVTSRSACPACRKKIKWQHLVPLFSWLFLRGKCAHCGKSISSHYFALELLTGLLFLGSFLTWNFLKVTPDLVDPTFLNYAIDWNVFQVFAFYIIEFSFLVVIFFYDLIHKEIPDSLSLPALAIAVAGGLIFGAPTAMAMLIGGLSIGGFFLLQFLLSRGTWIGGGDIRLGALMGVLLGWELGLLALVLSYLLGAVVSLYLLAHKKVKGNSAIPFGPFLVTGTLVTLFWGNELLSWYLATLI